MLRSRCHWRWRGWRYETGEDGVRHREVIRREKEWARSYVSQQASPRVHRSASHRLRRVPSYSAQCGMSLQAGNVHDKFEAPESVASHAPPRSSRRSSPEIISEEDELISSSTRRGDRDGGKPRNEHATIAELGAGIEQIKCSVKNLATEVSRMRETGLSRGDAQTQLLAEICAMLDAISKQKIKGVHAEGDKRNSSREEGSSSKGVNLLQSELLMNHFIEAMMYIA